ncbi:MAG: hypothetical protein HY820_35405 [Acidobacteria bacterium]|nr:hypothetical protein [Acidobacteriota bacterium]
MRKIQLLLPILAAVLAQAPAHAQTVLPAEIHVDDETVPAGGTVQLKFSLTEPRPIMTGTQAFDWDTSAMDQLFGVSLYSPAGDAYGVARYSGGRFAVKHISPQGSFGTVVDYPVLTVTSHVRPDAQRGWQSRVILGADSIFTDAFGITAPYVEPKAGILTIGGTVYVHNVIPAGGTWPAGTMVRIIGNGFSPAMQLRTKFKTRSVKFVSSTEVDLVLDRTTQMDSQPITIRTPDGIRMTYYAYLRGVEPVKSSNVLVASAEPVFPLITLANATITQQSRGIQNAVDTALSIQNSNAQPVIVVLTASNALGPIVQKTVTLNYGDRITRELGEFFATALAAGTTVRLAASAPVQIVPFAADQTNGTLTPILAFPY